MAEDETPTLVDDDTDAIAAADADETVVWVGGTSASLATVPAPAEDAE